MNYLVAGLILFLGIHSVAIAAPAWRGRVVAKLGERQWKGLYALVSLIGFVLLIYGYGQARQTPIVLYATPFWMRHVTMLLMLPVFPLFFASHLPGRIRTTLQHPMLAAVMLWAVAHLLVNGTLADLLLFGGFLVWAAVDLVSCRRRAQQVSHSAPPSRANDAIAVLAGVGVYLVFIFWLHPWLIGVPVLLR